MGSNGMYNNHVHPEGPLSACVVVNPSSPVLRFYRQHFVHNHLDCDASSWLLLVELYTYANRYPVGSISPWPFNIP